MKIICPKCGANAPQRKYGKAFSKTLPIRQRWHCTACDKTWTEEIKGIKISKQIIERINTLPQVQTPEDLDGWSAEYLIEQIVRVQLGLPSDYNQGDLNLVLAGKIIV